MPKIGAVILAAGASSRLGRPKQLIQLGAKSLLRHIVDAATDAGCSPIVVVIGTDALPSASEEAAKSGAASAKAIARELKRTGAMIVRNKNWQRGIGSSIRTGVHHLIDNAKDVDAIVLLVCDQPFVDGHVIRRLIALHEETRKPIVASSYADTLGVPALFDRVCFQELLALEDATGAKPVILRDRQRVAEFPFAEGEIDIDRVADYQRIRRPPQRSG